MLRINDEIKITACNVRHLKRQMHGRKDCIIFISYSCSKEIKEMDYLDYLELEEDLKARNIKIQEEDNLCQKKRKKQYNNLTKLVELRKNKAGKIKHDTCICSTRELETILNLIQKPQEEIKLLKEQQQYVIDEYEETIEKKDRQIDKMAERMEWLMKNAGICLDLEHEHEFTQEDIKQYFEGKVEHENT